MIELCLAILNPTANQIYGECGVQRGSGAFAVPGLLKNKNENSEADTKLMTSSRVQGVAKC